MKNKINTKELKGGKKKMEQLITVDLKQFICQRCGHKWFPKNPLEKKIPVSCPKCKSPYWNKPYQRNVETNPSNKIENDKKE